jgi:tRNA threonylcarbamoyladenosine biosynthesis protein TsaE
MASDCETPGELSPSIKFDIADLEATEALAHALANLAETGDVIALHGDLGAGKTAFARFFIRVFGGEDEEVPSPTFSLVQVYAYPEAVIWHFDFYRLKAPEESYDLGLDDAYNEGISLMEWPERLGPELPKDRLDVNFEVSGERRTARLTPRGNWRGRLDQFAVEGVSQV